MTQDIIERVRGLDDLTAVKLLRDVGPMLFKDPKIRSLVDRFPPSAGPLAALANLLPAQKRETLTSERSIWLARALVAALASQPRFAEVLAKALMSLRRDELVVEAGIPRGLATAIVRLLASAREAENVGVTYSKAVTIPGESAPDPLVDLAVVALAPEHTPLPAPDAGATPVTPESKDTRTAWPHLKCDEAVVIGTPFDVEVGLGAERDRQLGGTGRLVLPAQGCTLDAQLMFDPASFAIIEGQRRFKLEVTAADPYPRLTVKMVALGGPDLVDRRDIGVTYELGGVLVGCAWRGVLAVTSLAEAPPPEATKPFAGIDLADFRVEEEADLTIIIKRGDDAGSGRLSFAACSPHFVLPVAEEPPTANLGTQPAKFLGDIIRKASASASPWELFRTLKGCGRDPIAVKLPAPIKDALRTVVSHVAPRTASVLIVSDDPYVPWELAVIEPPLATSDSNSSPFLGAQVALGRWSLPAGDRPSPHPSRRLAVREQAVVTGVYERIPRWQRLDRAEEEARDLLKAWEGTSQKVEATFEDVMNCLDGNPAADVLHFALHGQFDLSGLEDGLVLIERPPGESSPAKPIFLNPYAVQSSDFRKFARSPFVFLNACQVGAGKEVLGDYAGMAKAFLVAGASAVVAPLWSIADADACGLALEFYEDSWKGEPPAEILRRQRARFTELAAKKKSAEPGSPTHLAYQFFGHPKYVLERHATRSEGRP